MPTKPARDGGHTAFTDHRIVRRPEPDIEPRPDRLVAWREPPAAYATRNLGLAYVATGERNQLPGFIQNGRELLLAAREQFGNDHAVLTSLGVASLRIGLSREAVDYFQRAMNLRPDAAAYHVNLATALEQTGNSAAAIEHLKRAIDLDASLEVAYRRLAEIYAKKHRENELREVFERYLRFRPQSLAAADAIRNAPPNSPRF
jgi:tetratricopeptide (TPR) repeat protein